MDSDRRGHLLRIVERARESYRQWVETGDSHILPEDDLYDRFSEIADQAAVIKLDRAEPLERLFVELAPHWRAFVTAQQTTADTTMLPGPELWACWQNLSAASQEARLPRLKHIETIAELVEQRVPPAQVCKIYGFVDDAGNPDLQKLREEREKPGKHTGPGTGWVAPVNRELQAQIDRMLVEEETLNRRRAAKVEAATTPAPESIESLVAAGVSVKQIATLKRMTPEQVLDYCRQHQLQPPPYDYTGLMQAPAAHDPEISPERQAALGRLGNEPSPQDVIVDHPDEVLERIAELPEEEQNQILEAVTYFRGGSTLADIAGQMLGADGRPLHVNKVRALLTKAGLDPALAGAVAAT